MNYSAARIVTVLLMILVWLLLIPALFGVVIAVVIFSESPGYQSRSEAFMLLAGSCVTVVVALLIRAFCDLVLAVVNTARDTRKILHCLEDELDRRDYQRRSGARGLDD